MHTPAINTGSLDTRACGPTPKRRHRSPVVRAILPSARSDFPRAIAPRDPRDRSSGAEAVATDVDGLSTFGPKHRRDRAQEDLDVKPRRPAINVFEILLDPAIELPIAPALDLPEARNAG